MKAMEKGQTSFDLLLTAIVLLAVFGSLTAITGFLEEKEKASIARQQQEQILSGIAGIITTSGIISDTTAGSSVAYAVPKIFVFGQEQPCTISFDTTANRISISTSLGEKSITAEKRVFFQAGLTYAEDDCGGEISISK